MLLISLRGWFSTENRQIPTPIKPFLFPISATFFEEGRIRRFQSNAEHSSQTIKAVNNFFTQPIDQRLKTVKNTCFEPFRCLFGACPPSEFRAMLGTDTKCSCRDGNGTCHPIGENAGITFRGPRGCRHRFGSTAWRGLQRGRRARLSRWDGRSGRLRPPRGEA